MFHHKKIIYYYCYFLFAGAKIYRVDRHCAMTGGLCVHKNDCAVPTTKKGLCPSYTHLGVECCYERKICIINYKINLIIINFIYSQLFQKNQNNHVKNIWELVCHTVILLCRGPVQIVGIKFVVF